MTHQSETAGLVDFPSGYAQDRGNSGSIPSPCKTVGLKNPKNLLHPSGVMRLEIALLLPARIKPLVCRGFVPAVSD